MNQNGHTPYQNLRDTEQTVLRRKVIAFNTYIKLKQTYLKTKKAYQTAYFYPEGNRKETKFQINRSKEIVKLKAEIKQRLRK